MKLKIVKNPDNEFYEEITNAVKANDGYCPCLIYRDESSKCICEDFKNQAIEGFCHCKRYKKVLIEE